MFKGIFITTKELFLACRNVAFVLTVLVCVYEETLSSPRDVKSNKPRNIFKKTQTPLQHSHMINDLNIPDIRDVAIEREVRYVSMRGNLSKDIVFVHIPKTGGTKIEHILNHIVWPTDNLPQIVLPKANSRKRLICTMMHIPPDWFKNFDFDPYLTHNTVVVFRNPYDRAISQFGFSCWANRKNGGLKSVLEFRYTGSIKSCQSNRRILNLYLKNAIPRFAKKLWHTPYGNRKSILDCHMVPQVEYIQQDKKTHILCGSNPDFSIVFKQFIQSHGQKLPASEIIKLKLLHSLPKYPSEQVLESDVVRLINKYYADDFVYCKYKIIDPGHIEPLKFKGSVVKNIRNNNMKKK